MILVTRYDLRRPVTDANVEAIRTEVDGVIQSLASSRVNGRRVSFGACDQALGTLEKL